MKQKTTTQWNKKQSKITQRNATQRNATQRNAKQCNSAQREAEQSCLKIQPYCKDVHMVQCEKMETQAMQANANLKHSIYSQGAL